MLVILILDDNPNRHRSFARNLVGHPKKHVHTAPETIAALEQHAPSLLFLDFDLDQFGRSIEEVGTGLDVADFLISNVQDFAPQTRVVVHSLNPLGADEMVRRLMAAGYSVQYAPHAWENEAILEQLAAWAGT